MKNKLGILLYLWLASGFLFVCASSFSPPLAGVRTLTHTVEEGDTLWSICEKYYGNPDLWPKLWQINPFVTNPHLLREGDKIQLLEKVPEKAAEGQAAIGLLHTVEETPASVLRRRYARDV